MAHRQETPGEDPTLNGDYAEGFVGGFQTGVHTGCSSKLLTRLLIVLAFFALLTKTIG